MVIKNKKSFTRIYEYVTWSEKMFMHKKKLTKKCDKKKMEAALNNEGKQRLILLIKEYLAKCSYYRKYLHDK